MIMHSRHLLVAIAFAAVTGCHDHPSDSTDAGTCGGGSVVCGGACIDPNTNDQYCGATGDCTGAQAGTACAAGLACSSGQCGLACQGGYVNCAGTCVDPASDPQHCGASADCADINSGRQCDVGSVCSDGACVAACSAGAVDCNGACIDPQVTASHCGASDGCQAGAVCGAAEVCSGGACAASCNPGQVACNGSCVAAGQCTSTEMLFYADAALGNDANPGTQALPFASVQRLADAIRSYETATPTQTVRAILRGGTYELDAPVTFTEQHSGTSQHPVIIEAFPGETPILTGGPQITGWTNQGNDVWSAQVPPGSSFKTLQVNGARAIRARSPNYDANNPAQGGFMFDGWCGQPWEKGMFGYAMHYGQSNGSLSWDLDVPSTASYVVWLRYSNTVAAPSAAFQLSAGATPVTVSALPVPTPGQYAWANAGTIALTAGATVLQLSHVGTTALELDALVVAPGSWDPTQLTIAADGSFTPAATGNLLVVQAESASATTGSAFYSNGYDTTSYPVYSFDHLCVPAAQWPAISSWTGAQISVFPTLDSPHALLDITVDPVKHTITPATFAGLTYRSGNRFFVENVLDALDAENEWYLDAPGGILYYKTSQGDPGALHVRAPLVKNLLVFQGDAGSFVHDIQISGLTFTNTDYTDEAHLRPWDQEHHGNNIYYSPIDGAIEIYDANDIAIRNSQFTDVGSYAIGVGQLSHNVEISGNTMSDLGSGGVALGEVSWFVDQPYGNIVSYNTITNYGRIFKQGSAAIYLTSSSANLISHNNISTGSFAGIRGDSRQTERSYHNVVEYNRVVDTCLEVTDMGPVYFWAGGNADSQDDTIRYNVIKNSGGLCTSTSGELLSPCFTQSIYLDERISGVNIQGNVIVNSTSAGVKGNSAHDVSIDNNIFYTSPNQQQDLHSDDVIIDDLNWWASLMTEGFTHNIVVDGHANRRLIVVEDTWNNTFFNNVDNNLYWDVSSNIGTATGILPIGNGSLAAWQAQGYDTHSMVADPLLTDPEHDDFSLPASSPALALGFTPLPLTKIGNLGYPTGHQPLPFTPVDDMTVDLGAPVQFTVSTSNGTSAIVAYELPVGATFDPSSGAFAWTPADTGRYPVTFFVETTDDLGDYMTVTINVVGNQTHHWSLNETSGTIAHDDTNLDDGTVNLAAGTTSGWTPAEIGNGFFFDGVHGDSIQIVDRNSQIFPPANGPFTIAMWLRIQLENGTARALMSNEEYNTSGFRFALMSNNTLQFWSTQSGGTLGLSSGALATNTWYRVAVTFDGTTGTLYINGTQSAAATGHVVSNPLPISVGNGIGGFAPFDGTVDELQIFNRALTAVEVSAL